MAKKTSQELAVVPLHAVEVLFLHVVKELPFAVNRQRVVLESLNSFEIVL